jgi:hypothetical protein
VIEKLKPKTLILGSDGPRNFSDMYRINKYRMIFDEVSLDCDIYRLYNDCNVGILGNTMSAYDFVFGSFERAIIIEDDILPSLDFFKYCNYIDSHYGNNSHLLLANGLNPFKFRNDLKNDIVF